LKNIPNHQRRIASDGSVDKTDVIEQSVNNTKLTDCMLQRIKRWEFPKPAGGGVVNVTFPWIFKAAGDQNDDD
jgi:hypothetical protein